MTEKEVVYVRFSRRTRGMSYFASCMMVPTLTILLSVIITAISFGLAYALGPGQFSSPLMDPKNWPLVIILTLVLSLILVLVFFSPSRIDKFIDWWYGL